MNSPERLPAILLRVGRAPVVDRAFPTSTKALRAFIGGPFDCAWLEEKIVRALEQTFRMRFRLVQGPAICACLVVHDEGLVLGLPRNRLASQLYGALIVGDALVMDVP